MSRKRNNNKKQPKPAKQKRRSAISFELSKSILGGLFALAASIVALYEAIDYFRNDPQTFYFIIFPILAGVASLGLLIQAFRKENPVAYASLAVGLLVITVALIGWKSYVETVKSKLVVVIATFDGPEEVYGLRNEIIESLDANFKDDSEVRIVPINYIVTPADGSEVARKLGEQKLADVVIWGWYRPTENPNISIHLENLTQNDFSILNRSETYRPSATLIDLKSFKIQKRIGLETTNLLYFLVGFLQYKHANWKSALESFEKVSINGEDIPVVDQKFLFLYTGDCYWALGEYERAIQDLDRAIQIDANFAAAYGNRGSSYIGLGEYERAIQDLDRAIQIDANLSVAYNNLGVIYFQLGQHQRAIHNMDKAIQTDPDNFAAYSNRGTYYLLLGKSDYAIRDLDKAIQIEPNFPGAYNTRGYMYYQLGQQKRAIRDFDRVIKIDPNLAGVYGNRGLSYFRLGQYERAIKDFDKAIQLDGNFASDYVGRGVSYYELGQYNHAIEDLNQAIQLDPGFAVAYKSRGNVYQALGNIAEAEADFKKYEELTGEKP